MIKNPDNIYREDSMIRATDKTLISVFDRLYKIAHKKSAPMFKISAEKFHKLLRLKDVDYHDVIEGVRRLRGIYFLFDLIDIKYDKKHDYYKFKVAFLLDGYKPDTPSFMKFSKRFFNPKFYKKFWFPRYDNKEFVIG